MPVIQRIEFPDFQGKENAAKAVFRSLPTVVGTIATNFFKDRFQRQGWQDIRYQRWQARKHTGRKGNVGRAILVKSGRLRRSIRVIRKSPDSVTIGSDVPYARIHNEGGTINHPGGTPYIIIKGKPTWIRKRTAQTRKEAGKYVKYTNPHPIKIPQRRFIGPSKTLDKRIVFHLEKALEKVL